MASFFRSAERNDDDSMKGLLLTALNALNKASSRRHTELREVITKTIKEVTDDAKSAADEG